MRTHLLSPLRVLLVAMELAAIIGLVASFQVPWFRSTAPRTDLVVLPPGYTWPFDVSYGTWQQGKIDTAVTLTWLGLAVVLVGVILRVALRRPWTRTLLLLGFASSSIGAILTYAEPDVPLAGMATATPWVGLWLFGVSAAVGVIVAGADVLLRTGTKPASAEDR
jgi:hypothetical protein